MSLFVAEFIVVILALISESLHLPVDQDVNVLFFSGRVGRGALAVVLPGGGGEACGGGDGVRGGGVA